MRKLEITYILQALVVSQSQSVAQISTIDQLQIEA
jgi:hypothetical protein